MGTLNENIGLRIKQLREEKGWDIKKLGQLIGVDNSTLGKIEKGKNGITLPMMLEICSTFNVSSDWLLSGGDRIVKSETKAANQDQLLLKVYELTLNIRAHEKANGAMLKELYKAHFKVEDVEVDSKYSSLLERFLTQGLLD